MQGERRAVVDIGTNSVKLLVGNVHGQTVTPVFESSHQTRLGHGFYDTHILQAEAIRQTALAAADFARRAHELNATTIRVIATSAVRDAENGRELVEAIREACGLQLRVITGEEEAIHAYRGVLTDPKFADKPLLLLDMGGGSTEFVLGCAGVISFRHSFAIGTLRLMDHLQISDPPKPEELQACQGSVRGFLREQVRPLLRPAIDASRHQWGTQALQLTGTGGTASILARIEAGLPGYDREAMEAVAITRERMREHTQHLWSLPIQERRGIKGLPANRADVILTGAATYTGIMEEFGFETLRVSTRGLRFSILLDPAPR
jgi:exopolyphosphatase/guanosine-5'-triphosphate,3'-diphosphate pyrophosphatase